MARNKGVKTPEKLWLRSFAGREFTLPIVIISLLMLSYCARGGGTPVPENREAGVLDSSAAPITAVDSGSDVVLPFCGNGKIDQESEQCDITDLGEATCATLGTLEGELGCKPDCTFNDVMCYPVVVEETTSGSGAETAGGYGGAP